MLSFMRKHQKYFYVLITFVIVISFSFFGTYSTIAGNSIHEQVAFTTVDGQPIKRSELEEMALFIGTDSEDKILFGGGWGANFLNDGVIRRDFLETGLAQILMESYSDQLQVDMQSRFAKELRFKPYIHPNAKYVSSRSAWTYFAPSILTNLQKLQQAENPLASEALQARINLYLAERSFPAPFLRQILRYQEQNSSVPHDDSMDYQDLSLFGYHTSEDWFGSRFNHLIAEFIFNAAALAEEKGYHVSKEEALAELLLNAQRSFQENKKSPQMGVANSSEYFDQQLVRMRLDRTKATKLWQKVLLFRRLFDDVGQSVFVDTYNYQTFNRFANQQVNGELYRLPSALRFSDFKTLQRFETYLDAVSKRNKEDKNILLMPKTLLTVQEIAKRNPELVYKQYKLEVGSVNKKNLQARVTAKETLAWEIDNANWSAIKKQFPELGLKKADTKEQRLEAIDQLDGETRSRMDRYAREMIVAAHPEWIEKALSETTKEVQTVNLSLKGSQPLFVGLEKGEELMKLLDKAEINQEQASLQKLSFDQQNFYQVRVIERSPELALLTFQEANRSQLLDDLTDQALDMHYVQIRSQDSETYQNSDKSWKPLSQVRNQVALSYFDKVLKAIKADLTQRDEKYKQLDGERLAAYRFAVPSDDLNKQLQKNPALANTLTVSAETPINSSNQFKWVKSDLRLSQKSEQGLADSSSLFKQEPNSWSSVQLAANGDVYFAFVKEKGQEQESKAMLHDQIVRARIMLGSEAMEHYLRSILPLLKEKNAISFEYLHRDDTSLEPEIDPVPSSDV